ncbi:phosphotransferase family protein [Kitasatospora sp. NPDC004614]|uniref:phosphotransferase family protein n=1 Tax=unclassified Kitasatospora TaxID=2633591 RepID=UPI00368C0D64
MTTSWTTHGVEFLPDTVRKRFRPDADGDPDREWRALTLLDRYAPGLAPRPLSLDGRTVTMSRLRGIPLRGTELTTAHLDALARATDRLLHAVPPEEVAALPERRWYVGDSVAAIRRRAARPSLPSLPSLPALVAGLRWLAGAEASLSAPWAPVLGQADGNLANFLWDGADVRLVDFEDSGRSDRPYELAELVEHLSAWVDTDLDAAAFLGRFTLSPAEQARLLECRRLFALLWLVFLATDPATAARNPPGTTERQAARLLALLDY